MSDCRCVLCDCTAVAHKGKAEEAIASALIIAVSGTVLVPDAPDERLQRLKSSFCADHRQRWPFLILAGALALDSEASPAP